MSKHTQGNWEARNYEIHVWGRGCIARIPLVNDGGTFESQENIRLIAAAPKLLEALTRVLANNCPITGNPSRQKLKQFWEGERMEGRGEADDMLFALDAISQATGES